MTLRSQPPTRPQPPAHTLRALGVDDLEALHALEKRAQPLPWSDDQLLLELVNEQGKVHGVFVDGAGGAPTLIGHCCTRRMVDELWILNIAIDPAHRRQYFAWALLETALQHGRAALMTSVWLEVRESNAAARALYAAMGFTDQATRGTYYPPIPPATEREAAVVMSRPL